jgi:hypothetical protein
MITGFPGTVQLPTLTSRQRFAVKFVKKRSYETVTGHDAPGKNIWNIKGKVISSSNTRLTATNAKILMKATQALHKK